MAQKINTNTNPFALSFCTRSIYTHASVRLLSETTRARTQSLVQGVSGAPVPPKEFPRLLQPLGILGANAIGAWTKNLSIRELYDHK